MAHDSWVYISIGSNIEPEKHLQQAVNLLKLHCQIKAVSSVYQAPAFGFTDQPDFLDIVVALSTHESPAAFKRTLHDIEKHCGRDRTSQANKYGPLTLDIDILLWGDGVLDYGEKPWHVPDKSILKYAAVAVPLAEIAPEMLHPEEKQSLAQIAARFDAAELTRLPLKIEW